jgi:hypothetical protein
VALVDKEIVSHPGDFLIEVVDSFEPESCESLGGLATFALFARNERRSGFDRFDPFAAEPANVGFPAVKNDQPEQTLVAHHLFEWFGQKLRVTVIAERLDWLWWPFEDAGNHFRLSPAVIDSARKEHHPVFRRLDIVVFQPVFDAFQRILNVRPGFFRFDVARFGVFLRNVSDDIAD